jgi:hypothetical protein
MTNDEFEEAAQEVRDLAEALDQACVRAVEASDAIADPQQALERSVPLADFIAVAAKTLATHGADLGRRPTQRIWKAEELSLARLADRTGISRKRAGSDDAPEESPEA